MTYSFKARIYKAGINPCVKVPVRITKTMTAIKGYIPVKGKIEDHPFEQTLCPVKNDLYRLYVNGPMLKGANVKVGQPVHFSIEQAGKQKDSDIPMPAPLKKKLKEYKLLATFEALAPYRQKEILRYLNNIKTEATLLKNIKRLIKVLQGKATSPLLRVK
ncbi:MAG TPA: YdeI/OmpD-associated family protein [Chitinophagaceae bacterium]|nr:YdeI/OmpD-associated family protein [Chitinophagaceae bacterium]